MVILPAEIPLPVTNVDNEQIVRAVFRTKLKELIYDLGTFRTPILALEAKIVDATKVLVTNLLLTRRKLLILPKDEIVQIRPVETFIILVEIPGKKFTVDACEMSVESVERPGAKFSVDKPKDTLVLAELVCRIIILEKLETPEKIVVLSDDTPHAVNSLNVD